MKMVAEREAKEMASDGMDDSSYNSADVQDLPKPPYFFKVRVSLLQRDLVCAPELHRTIGPVWCIGMDDTNEGRRRVSYAVTEMKTVQLPESRMSLRVVALWCASSFFRRPASSATTRSARTPHGTRRFWPSSGWDCPSRSTTTT